MPFTRLYYHLVWSTKNRLPMIALEFELRLFPYLRLKAVDLNYKVPALNGDRKSTRLNSSH